MAGKLTPKQQRIYDFIRAFTAEHGYPPSVREIADAVNLRSPSTVHFHLKALEEAGVILRSSGKTRAITLIDPPEQDQKPADSEKDMIPLIGNVAAGSPIWAEQAVEGYIPFDLRGSRQEHYALKIRGDSMINAGILPGDYVIVRCQNTADNGEIIIALLGDEATCKRLRCEEGKVWLIPENDCYAPIDGTGALIQGKVVGVVRQYD